MRECAELAACWPGRASENRGHCGNNLASRCRAGDSCVGVSWATGTCPQVPLHALVPGHLFVDWLVHLGRLPTALFSVLPQHLSSISKKRKLPTITPLSILRELRCGDCNYIPQSRGLPRSVSRGRWALIDRVDGSRCWGPGLLVLHCIWGQWAVGSGLSG